LFVYLYTTISKFEGLLDGNALQIYVVALWKLGKRDLALTAARNLAKILSTLKQRCAVAASRLICSLIYCVSGQNPAATFILKLPRDLLQSTKMSLIISTINALNPTSQLEMLLQSNLQNFASHDVITELHSIMSMSKMVKFFIESKFYVPSHSEVLVLYSS